MLWSEVCVLLGEWVSVCVNAAGDSVDSERKKLTEAFDTRVHVFDKRSAVTYTWPYGHEWRALDRLDSRESHRTHHIGLSTVRLVVEQFKLSRPEGHHVDIIGLNNHSGLWDTARHFVYVWQQSIDTLRRWREKDCFHVAANSWSLCCW